MKNTLNAIKNFLLMVIGLVLFVAGTFFGDTNGGQRTIEVATNIQEFLEGKEQATEETEENHVEELIE